ncbi:MAG: hypothetical protein FWC55_07460 [Firmicutes bacterium]|nr:hypothetical protein [Bacillota bacterium]
MKKHAWLTATVLVVFLAGCAGATVPTPTAAPSSDLPPTATAAPVPSRAEPTAATPLPSPAQTAKSGADTADYAGLYKPVLDAYTVLEQSGYTNFDESILGSGVCLAPNGGGSYFIQDTNPILSYAFYDLNGDGAPELLIGADLGITDGNTAGTNVFITGIYGLQDGKPVSLLQVGRWSQFALCVDSGGNCVIEEISGTHIEFVAEDFYEIDQAENIVTLDKLRSYGGDYDENSGYTSYTHTKDINGTEVSITEQEYITLSEKYGSVGYLDTSSNWKTNQITIHTWKLLTQHAPTPSPNTPLCIEQPFTQNRYIQFMAGLNPDIAGMDELFYKETDMDGDGNTEITAAFGQKADDETQNWIEASFVLRDNGGDIELIGRDFIGEGYTPYKMWLVQFTGSDAWYIIVGVTNDGYDLLGIEIFNISGSEVNKVAYDASATGAGDTYLDDRQSDGTYGGYTSERHSYDVLYYGVTTFYAFEDGKFIQRKSGVDVGDYPATPTDAVVQYLSLTALNQVYPSDDSAARINEICASPVSLDMGNFDWFTAIWSYEMEFGPNVDFPRMTASEKTAGQTSSVTVNTSDKKGNPLVTYTFNLSAQSGQWRIISLRRASG